MVKLAPTLKLPAQKGAPVGAEDGTLVIVEQPLDRDRGLRQLDRVVEVEELSRRVAGVRVDREPIVDGVLAPRDVAALIAEDDRVGTFHAQGLEEERGE